MTLLHISKIQMFLLVVRVGHFACDLNALQIGNSYVIDLCFVLPKGMRIEFVTWHAGCPIHIFDAFARYLFNNHWNI